MTLNDVTCFQELLDHRYKKIEELQNCMQSLCNLQRDIAYAAYEQIEQIKTEIEIKNRLIKICDFNTSIFNTIFDAINLQSVRKNVKR